MANCYSTWDFPGRDRERCQGLVKVCSVVGGFPKGLRLSFLLSRIPLEASIVEIFRIPLKTKHTRV
jgi:hypothetical protein